VVHDPDRADNNHENYTDRRQEKDEIPPGLLFLAKMEKAEELDDKLEKGKGNKYCYEH
jgi:hypothetical protein